MSTSSVLSDEPSLSPYQVSIQHTLGLIQRRGAYFRNQVILVVGISTLIALVTVAQSVTALWALLVIVPACGVFFLVDATVLGTWLVKMLAFWVSGEIHFVALNASLRANPGLPEATLGGMLHSLPPVEELAFEQELLRPTRQAIAAVSLAMHRARADALLLQTIASAIVVGGLLAAIWMGSWKFLWALAVVALLPLARGWTARRRHRRAAAEVAACRLQPGFDNADFARVRASLR